MLRRSFYTSLVTAALLSMLASATLSPAWAQKGCSQGDPAVAVDQALWSGGGVLRPGRIMQDATRYNGTQQPDSRFPVTTWVDIENGYLFVSYYGGFQIWDATGAKAGEPVNLVTINGQTQFPQWQARGEVREFAFGIDAPEGNDSLMVVGGIDGVGVSIWERRTRRSRSRSIRTPRSSCTRSTPRRSAAGPMSSRAASSPMAVFTSTT